MDQRHTDAAASSTNTQFCLEQLRKAIAEARRHGFQVRSEWLGGSAEGWCEIAGRRILFVDLSLSVDEQLEQVLSAIASVQGDQRAA